MNFDGIWTPIVTPFTANGQMDLSAVAPLVDRLVEQKIAGLIVGGTTGEYYALSNQERKDLLKHVVGLARGRIPLMAGINATTTDESLDIGLYAKGLGYESILVAAPYYCQPTQDELLAHTLALDDAINLPTMLYNFPARTGTEMGFDYIDALKSRPISRPSKKAPVRWSACTA